MFATLYTAPPVASFAMGKPLHDPQAVLARNLRALFEKRQLSARAVAKPIGTSNKTVSNMLNGEGAPQLDKLMAVAAHLHVPLWQLFCPGIAAGRFGEEAVHQLIEQFCSLSEFGRARFLQNLDDAVTAEQVKRSPPEKNHA